MGRVKDKLLELEESGIIEWSDDHQCYVSTLAADPEPFDLYEYLVNTQHKNVVDDNHELRELIKEKYSVTVLDREYIDLSIIQCVINTIRDFDMENQ